ncbi:MAG: isoleucine--tRNA ligase, partial [Legionellaceae bacterium]|nr:isoleucine--tRNA ligase [Legionellaceae bacterium]
MSSYKSTVHLPTTDFPMKAGLAQKEPQQCAMWEAQDIYRKIRDEKKGRTRFVLNDGPPYANGHLHCGHALNKILKDMVVKSKTMSGYDAPFVPGWDCHGLPIELHVEKKLGKVSKELSPKDFRAACRAYAESQIKIQLQEFQRLGVFGEWNNPYKTMDFSYEADVVRALAKIIKNGYVYRGEKPVHWCIACGSALAEAEVEYEDKVSSSIDVAFEVVDSSAFLQHTGIKENKSAKPVIVPIWTTTPWTLPANEAVCLHPEFMYGLVETEKAYYLILMDLMDSVLQRYDIQEHQLLGTFSGTHFEHILVRHPLYAERQVPIVLGMHVSTDAGTGAVHTAPAHGVEDYMVGLAYKLPFYNPVNTKGCYKADVPVFAGVSVLKANELVLAHLQERNTLLYATSLQHSYPHCWRHKTPMIFLATSQWFIAMDRSSNGQALLRSQILDNLDKVNFIPDWGKPRMMGMIEGRPDWCVSRQRMWGTPIPLFIHKETQELHPDTLALLDKVADAIEEKGVEAWFDLDVSAFLGADADSYMQVKDTLDVWFDAGISHYAVLQARADLAYPADLYLEGSDQYRGWFNSSVSTAVAMNGTAPYKAVLTHGYTVDS